MTSLVRPPEGSAGVVDGDPIFAAADIAMALCDADGCWRRVNAALGRLLGYSQAQLEGRRFEELLHVGAVPLGREALARLRSGEENRVEIVLPFLAAEGAVRRTQTSLQILSGVKATVSILMQLGSVPVPDARTGAVSDSLLLANLLESAPFQVYFKDRESRFLKASRQQATHLGFDDPEELLGKTDFDVFTADHARPAYAAEQEIIATGVPLLGFEELETLIDGRLTWAMTSKMPLRDEQDELIGTFGITQDVTERKRGEEQLQRSEERWRTLLAHIQEIVVLVNADGAITYASPALGRWLGHDPDDVVGRSLLASVHREDRERVEAAFEVCAREGTAHDVHRVRAKDGSWRVFESTLVSLHDEPALASLLITGYDVTERVAFERDRERLEIDRRLSQRLEAVGQLAAGIAHEINTPLQFVGDSLNFLKDAVEELLILTGRYREMLHLDQRIPLAERRRAMERAEEQADLEYLTERIPSAFTRTTDGITRVREIVVAMKRFSHTGSSEAEAADLNGAIETTLAVCRNEYKYVAEVDFQRGDLPLVTCNLGEINQVLLNLIVNAAQAIAENVGDSGRYGHITISTERAGECAVIRISDDGPGIPAELQDRIYEPFFTTKAVGKGTGQGLALALTTVARHAGVLELDSTLGVGTTFTVRLPLAGVQPGETAELVADPSRQGTAHR